MSTVLITGGSGFFGSILTKRLLDEGYHCVVVDLHMPEYSHPRLLAIQADIRDKNRVEQIFCEYNFATVYHCAAILAHAVSDRNFLWQSNVDGTRNIADSAVRTGVGSLIFTSSNCLWAESIGQPVREDEPPAPAEVYGQSKLAGEKVLAEYSDRLNAVVIRCPTIVDEGRLGLLSILFEFIQEGRKVWVIGGGKNRYQFIYAQDLASACIAAADFGRSETFHIGSDNVQSFREIYQYVIDRAGTGASIAALPRTPALAAMRLAHFLKISPLGPYHYKMIAEDFEFDTSLIKASLQWQPTLSNAEMLWRAYDYYRSHRQEISSRRNVSAHRQAAKMGVIRLLKWMS